MPQEASEIGLQAAVINETVAAASDWHQGEDDVRSELDARQDEVLRLLDELNEQIEAAIREFVPLAAEDRAAA